MNCASSSNCSRVAMPKTWPSSENAPMTSTDVVIATMTEERASSPTSTVARSGSSSQKARPVRKAVAPTTPPVKPYWVTCITRCVASTPATPVSRKATVGRRAWAPPNPSPGAKSGWITAATPASTATTTATTMARLRSSSAATSTAATATGSARSK